MPFWSWLGLWSRVKHEVFARVVGAGALGGGIRARVHTRHGCAEAGGAEKGVGGPGERAVVEVLSRQEEAVQRRLGNSPDTWRRMVRRQAVSEEQ